MQYHYRGFPEGCPGPLIGK